MVGVFNHSSTSTRSTSSTSSPKLSGAEGPWCIGCYHCSNYAYQGSPPPSSLIAMAAQASFSPDAVWITDSGASHHMVPHMTTMHNVTPCNSAENVVVGSGEGLHIAHIGKSHIPTCPSHSSSSAPSITPPELLASLELFQPEPYIVVLSEQQLQVLLPSIDSISSFSTASVQPSVPVESAPAGPSHSMLTSSKTGVVKKKDFSDYKCYTSIHDTTFMDEPSSYRVAYFSADWTKAIDEEISAL
ncbi:unnamed protein product [Prunus armeniaca]